MAMLIRFLEDHKKVAAAEYAPISERYFGDRRGQVDAPFRRVQNQT